MPLYQKHKVYLPESTDETPAKPNRAEHHQIATQADLSVTVHCPICRHPLIVVMTESGPAYHCGCKPKMCEE